MQNFSEVQLHLARLRESILVNYANQLCENVVWRTFTEGYYKLGLHNCGPINVRLNKESEKISVIFADWKIGSNNAYF